MKTAIYDNPLTFWRELYHDGAQVAQIGRRSIAENFVEFRQLQEAKDLLLHGPWTPGRVIGDIEALPEAVRAIVSPNPGSSGGAVEPTGL